MEIYGNFDLIKGYKLALLILCLLESLSYLELERWKELDNDTKHTIHSDFCFLVGTLKNIIGFAKESIQVTLLLITCPLILLKPRSTQPSVCYGVFPL